MTIYFILPKPIYSVFCFPHVHVLSLSAFPFISVFFMLSHFGSQNGSCWTNILLVLLIKHDDALAKLLYGIVKVCVG